MHGHGAINTEEIGDLMFTLIYLVHLNGLASLLDSI